uniref:Mitochondrial inner membrane protein Mpv17 n=1 Tax=Aceria tosichella TaxID=561515 RepID=A0A6G1S6Z6_9ACAR
MRNPIRLYRRLLHERPFITNVLTSTTFMAVGDVTSQLILQDKQRLDWHQTARFALAGFIFVGPVVRGCLVAIDKLFGPTSGLLVLSKKVLLDQVVIAPCFIAANVTVLTLLKERSFEKVQQELARSYLGILQLNYTFWPFVSVANFYFVPLAYRVVFASTAALVWNTIFSYKLCYKKQLTNHDTTSNYSD